MGISLIHSCASQINAFVSVLCAYRVILLAHRPGGYSYATSDSANQERRGRTYPTHSVTPHPDQLIEKGEVARVFNASVTSQIQQSRDEVETVWVSLLPSDASSVQSLFDGSNQMRTVTLTPRLYRLSVSGPSVRAH